MSNQQQSTNNIQVQCNSLDSRTTTTDLDTDQTKRRLVQQQLVFLLHARQCQKKNIADSSHSCNLPHCRAMKEILQHIDTCTVEAKCTTPFCYSSKQLISHWKHCTQNDCPLCLPLKQTTSDESTCTKKRKRTDQICECADSETQTNKVQILTYEEDIEYERQKENEIHECILENSETQTNKGQILTYEEDIEYERQKENEIHECILEQHKKRLQFEDLKIKLFKEKHELEMKLMKEKHELELTLMKK